MMDRRYRPLRPAWRQCPRCADLPPSTGYEKWIWQAAMGTGLIPCPEIAAIGQRVLNLAFRRLLMK